MSRYDGGVRSERRASIAAYARLVRVPNLFTAPPDVILGAAVVAGLGHAVRVEAVAGLAVASALLYAAGTTLNDYFDAAEDARDRPERPIPSGEVPHTSALLLGVAALAGGVVVAALVGGAAAGAVAGALAVLVSLYDVSRSRAGILFMGASRGTNVLLGTAAAVSPTALPADALSVPALVALYVVGVTYMAESETGTGDPAAVSAAVAGAAVAAAGVVGTLVVRSPPLLDVAVAALLLAGFGAWTGRALRAAYSRPSPETIGPAVGACVLGLIPLNAAFAAASGVGWALAAAACLVPASGLAGAFDVT